MSENEDMCVSLSKKAKFDPKSDKDDLLLLIKSESIEIEFFDPPSGEEWKIFKRVKKNGIIQPVACLLRVQRPGDLPSKQREWRS